jgi:hypothetical protein
MGDIRSRSLSLCERSGATASNRHGVRSPEKCRSGSCGTAAPKRLKFCAAVGRPAPARGPEFSTSDGLARHGKCLQSVQRSHAVARDARCCFSGRPNRAKCAARGAVAVARPKCCRTVIRSTRSPMAAQPDWYYTPTHNLSGRHYSKFN